MTTGAITGYIDVAQITLYAFWIFFAGLIYYLLQEGKREGYPLENDRSHLIKVQGWPPIPAPKTYLLQDGSTVTAPNDKRSNQTLKAAPLGNFPGAPLEPTGDKPMLDGVGPGAWADRADKPDVTYDGELRIVPLVNAPGFGVAHQDTDPRGLSVFGADGVVGGKVTDVWVDRSESMFRYLEVALANGRQVLVPINFTRISAHRITVRAILGRHFDDIPGIRLPTQVTLLEEEKIMAYFGAGTLYATPGRQEPLL
jgi:photosynthetic reaction center H subunit